MELKKENKLKTHFIKLQIVKERPVEYSGKVTSAGVLGEMMTKIIGNDSSEGFYVIGVDVKNRVNFIHKIGCGSPSQVSVDVSEVFRAALLTNSVAVAVCHNHPSGDTEPSSEDVSITKRIKDAAKLLGIRFLDHIVVAESNYYSIEHGTSGKLNGGDNS
jgi:DNA repair protein RadC